jgi:hypothetical protein
MSAPEPFPYIGEFITSEELLQLWYNALKGDYAIPHMIQLNNAPPSIPKGFQWKFHAVVPGKTAGDTICFITDPSVYEKVDKLTNYFTDEARMKANVDSCPSPYDYYHSQYDKVLQRAIALEKESKVKHPSRYFIREAVYKLTNECSTFKISVTKAIFKMFKSRVVLDPSADWGDRILGAAAAGVEVYHGIDPNPNLRSSYDKILKFLKARGVGVTSGTYDLITSDFLKLDIKPESYDTVFTSPPFWNYEVYVQDSAQSIHNKKDINDWIMTFFQPYLKKAWTALVTGGYMILYVSDVKTGEYVARMADYITRELGGKYMGILCMGNNPDYVWPIWVWQK